jgi:large subunit ribosomal protein L17
MRKLNKPTAHRKAMLKNLATDLLWNGKIETTLPKAKEVASYAEKLLTLAGIKITHYEGKVPEINFN